MKKRFISTVLCAAMAASLVTGCGSGSGNASGGSTQAAADTGSKKEVVIWDYFETDAQKAMMTTLLDGFNASQDEYVASHVYVPFSDYEKQLTLGIASGELPDLVILDGCSMASFISLGLFGDISGPGGECAGVNQAFFYVLRNVDGLAFEAFVHKAAVGYDVSRKYQAALLGYADCFA